MNKIEKQVLLLNKYGEALQKGSPFHFESSLPHNKEIIKKIIKNILSLKIVEEEIEWEYIAALTEGYSNIAYFIEDNEAIILNEIFKKAQKNNTTVKENKLFSYKIGKCLKKSIELNKEIYEYLCKFPQGEKWVKEIKDEIQKNNLSSSSNFFK